MGCPCITFNSSRVISDDDDRRSCTILGKYVVSEASILSRQGTSLRCLAGVFGEMRHGLVVQPHYDIGRQTCARWGRQPTISDISEHNLEHVGFPPLLRGQPSLQRCDAAYQAVASRTRIGNDPGCPIPQPQKFAAYSKTQKKPADSGSSKLFVPGLPLQREPQTF